MAAYYMPLKDTGKGSTVRQWEEAFAKLFGGNKLDGKPAIEVSLEERVPAVCKSLKELNKRQKLSLRSSVQTITSNKVELKQFNPNFFSNESIWCRFPGCNCKQRKFEEKKKKKDLYLCPSHRNNLEDNVAKMCAQQGVSISIKYRSEDLQGYTSLIGLLESAFHSLSKPILPSPGSYQGKNSSILQGVCLNLRNFLIIVNALLNPDDDNCNTALNSPMAIVMRILEIIRDDGAAILETLNGLVDLLRRVIEHILFAFGIIYSWVYLSLIGNAGAHLGSGIGGFIGLVGYAAGPVVGTLTAIGGGIFGGLIGSGVYNIWNVQRQEGEGDVERLHRYQGFAQANIRVQEDPNNHWLHWLQAAPYAQQPAEDENAVYYLTGTATGDLALSVLYLFMLPM
ncbi:hypothetical protein QZH41_007983 [Actinostola sp. cb2023]|nr:hypothetical protein QZH41_007983 [Actinostola sp. cb2023]